MKKTLTVFGIILMAATAFAQNTPAPDVKVSPPQQIQPVPPQEHVATLKLTIKLLKQQERIQERINRANLKVSVAQTEQKIFQLQAANEINASNAK